MKYHNEILLRKQRERKRQAEKWQKMFERAKEWRKGNLRWACPKRVCDVNPIYGCTCKLVTGRFDFRASHVNEIILKFYRLKRIQRTMRENLKYKIVIWQWIKGKLVLVVISVFACMNSIIFNSICVLSKVWKKISWKDSSQFF